LPGNLLQFRYETVTKARAVRLPYGGASPSFFVYSWNQQNPNNLRKGRKMIKIDSNGNAFCLSCADEIEGVLVEREENCTNCSFDYEGTISFTTNKKLTQDQLNQLMDIISLQIIEPVDADQNDEDYSTRGVEVTVKEVE
jgi:hypothetical protein